MADLSVVDLAALRAGGVSTTSTEGSTDLSVADVATLRTTIVQVVEPEIVEENNFNAYPSTTTPYYRQYWVDFGGSFAPVEAWREPYSGTCHMQGLARWTDTSASGSNASICVLGLDFRPDATVLGSSCVYSGGTTRVDIQADGQIIVAASLTQDQWVALNLKWRVS